MEFMMLNQYGAFFTRLAKHRQGSILFRIISMALMASLGIGLAFSLLPGQPVFAAGPFSVNTFSDTHDSNSADSQCSDGAHCSLRAALEQASASGGATTINLPAGTYTLSLGDLIAGTKANTTITVHGAGAASTTIHQGQAGRTLIVVNFNVNANVVFNLDNVTVSGGSENENDPDGFGGNAGAILAGGSSTAAGNSVTITNVVFSGNYCSPAANAGCSGGAIDMTGGGGLTVIHSTFSGNAASKNAGTGSGGALYFDNSGNSGNVLIAILCFAGLLCPEHDKHHPDGDIHHADRDVAHDRPD